MLQSGPPPWGGLGSRAAANRLLPPAQVQRSQTGGEPFLVVRRPSAPILKVGNQTAVSEAAIRSFRSTGTKQGFSLLSGVLQQGLPTDLFPCPSFPAERTGSLRSKAKVCIFLHHTLRVRHRLGPSQHSGNVYLIHSFNQYLLSGWHVSGLILVPGLQW